jgi:hypothetical protein
MEEYPSLAEGNGLENRQVGKPARGFESLFLRHYCLSGSFLLPKKLKQAIFLVFNCLIDSA